MGQYSGYGTPQETNARFRRLLEAGQSGLSVALDLPTQMGLDSDHPQADGEVGKVGTPLDTVDDLIALLDGLPLENVRQIRTTANAIGPIFAAFVFVALEELGVDPGSVRVMLQNDPLKEYFARGTYIFPPAAGLRLAVDVVEHVANEIPRWEPIEFCGYHVRDSGGTAVDEVGIATADGIAYLDEARPPRARRDAARAPALPLPLVGRRRAGGGGEAARGAAAVGADPARALRRARERGRDQHLRLHARRRAHGAGAAEQRGARRLRDARRRVRRRADDRHVLVRRGARPALAGGGAPGAAHAADRRARVRRDEGRRPARRLVLRRGAHRRDRARVDPARAGDRRRRRHGRRDRVGPDRADDRRLVVQLPAARRGRRAEGRRRERAPRRGRGRARGVPGARGAAGRAARVARRAQGRRAMPDAVAAATRGDRRGCRRGPQHACRRSSRAARARVTVGEIVEALASVFGRYRAPSIRL